MGQKASKVTNPSTDDETKPKKSGLLRSFRRSKRKKKKNDKRRNSDPIPGASGTVEAKPQHVANILPSGNHDIKAVIERPSKPPPRLFQNPQGAGSHSAEPPTLKLYAEIDKTESLEREFHFVDVSSYVEDPEKLAVQLDDVKLQESIKESSMILKRFQVDRTILRVPKGLKITSMDVLRPNHEDLGMSFIVTTEQEKEPERVIDEYNQWQVLSTWFLGPKAENQQIFLELAERAFSSHCKARRKYARTDPLFITDRVKNTKAFEKGIEDQRKVLDEIVAKLENSVPSYSPRYQGHMLWDTAMPANLGYISALMYNQNNVAKEASPVTTEFEVKVGKQLCDMIFDSHIHQLTTEQLKKETKPAVKPWGHLVAGGSIANIEALWTTRNAKFVPLAMKRALTTNPALAAAKGFEIYIPRLEAKQKLLECSSWDLLNIDIDDVVKMPNDLAELAGCEENVCMDEAMKYSVMHLGLFGVMREFGLEKAPRIMCPATAHYSWRKAMNILGLGIDNLIAIKVDENARMDTEDLKYRLTECKEQKIPVLSVVAVIGSTEESSVDPLDMILKIREGAKLEGLNFVVNADAAWGGYFMTMLHKTANVQINKDSEEYVPSCSLSHHTIKQLMSVHLADTVTIDPHKSGFIPYPAGGLCYRNGKMRKFIKMVAMVVSHEGEEEDTAMGLCSVEGSKPGASAAGVYMAHKTIGLNKDGYGRILGQCTFGAKLFYCRWLTLAKDDDEFICIPMKDIPKSYMDDYKATMDSIKTIVNSCIFHEGSKTNEILEIEEVVKILRYCGPDTLINAFAVNIKGNDDIHVCNKFNKLVFRMLSHDEASSRIKRVPLILTHSHISPSNAWRVTTQFEKRLQVKHDPSESLHFLINTVMNPWIGRPDLVANLGAIFRDTVITAVGTMTDDPAIFEFVCVGRAVTARGTTIYAELIPSFSSKSHQYHTVVKFQLIGDVSAFCNAQGMCVAENYITLETKTPMVLGELLELKTAIDMEYFVQNSDSGSSRYPLQVKVVDVPRFQRFDKTKDKYEDSMTYFLYGDNRGGAHLSHVITRSPDFCQVLNLDFQDISSDDRYVRDVPAGLLEEGIMVQIEGMSGEPIKDKKTNAIVDPITEKEYKVNFIGVDGEKGQSLIRLTNPYAKVYFEELS